MIWKIILVHICARSRSSTGSAMTWPRSTWTVWKSDSTNLQLLVRVRAEGVDLWCHTLDLCSCLFSPCIQLWLSPSPCLNETLFTQSPTEKAHWTTCNILLTPFFAFPQLLCSNLYSFVPLYICQTRGHLIGAESIFYKTTGKAAGLPVLHLSDRI